MQTKFYVVMTLLTLLNQSLLFADYYPKYKPKYHLMTMLDAKQRAEKAADWFAKMIKEGKEKAALEELGKPPRYRLSEEEWKSLAQEINDPEVMKNLKIFKGKEFTESIDLLSFLNKTYDQDRSWKISYLVLQHAHEVTKNLWTSTPSYTYNLVNTFNCKKGILIAHPYIPDLVGVPIIDEWKDDKGNRVYWEPCRRLINNNNKSWWNVLYFNGVYPFLHDPFISVYMVNVPGTDYQIAGFSRIQELPVSELNQKYRRK